ncbi:hypothetical protein HFN88_05225 [Rhizobium laguerreae]|uniref:hypothetical protein n=1 Tax=Rhizobium laguerreae TaxID=1076926 RepID=UPI001C8FD8CF|nr:hypothetical protein [Rhizobium laguerreae]MBY3329009.1 hypothetical protein [Rhizobium laguerreae]MBY3392087.1 hypothetical protein [Rhizobium laguerreae]
MLSPVLLLRVLLFGICLLPPLRWAAAQDISDITPEGLSYRRLFHIEVHGTPIVIDGQPNLDKKKRTYVGKAFAIGRDFLVGPGHLVGNSEDWLAESSRGPEYMELDRVIRPIDRTITLFQVETYQPFQLANEETEVLVARSADGINAVGLTAPNVDVVEPFRLSLCDIVKGERYTALLTKDDPSQRTSLRQPVTIPVIARGYDPSQFGNLYVFEPETETGYSSGPDGVQGSPVLDKAGDVVAMVSVATDINGKKLLATPISPQFPGASSLMARIPRGSPGHGAVQCSLGQTVRQIYDRVAAQINWNVEVKYSKQDKKLDTISVSYDDPSEQPTVKEIKVKFRFYGVIDPATMRLEGIDSGSPLEKGMTLTLTTDEVRTFRSDKIGGVGRELVEKRLEECGNAACAVRSVTLQIIPKIDATVWPELRQDSREPTPIIRNIDWVEGL